MEEVTARAVEQLWLNIVFTSRAMIDVRWQRSNFIYGVVPPLCGANALFLLMHEIKNRDC